MIGCLRTRVRKQPVIALYVDFETVLKFYNFESSSLFPFKLNAKLERTHSNAQQNKYNKEPRNQLEAHQISDQQNHHLRTDCRLSHRGEGGGFDRLCN